MICQLYVIHCYNTIVLANIVLRAIRISSTIVMATAYLRRVGQVALRSPSLHVDYMLYYLSCSMGITFLLQLYCSVYVLHVMSIRFILQSERHR